jgi:hypothetical protein
MEWWHILAKQAFECKWDVDLMWREKEVLEGESAGPQGINKSGARAAGVEAFHVLHKDIRRRILRALSCMLATPDGEERVTQEVRKTDTFIFRIMSKMKTKLALRTSARPP